MGKTKNEVLLSIIVPVYNVELFLEDCIRGVECIKTPKEVICINDGSTDDSLLLLEKLAIEFDDILILQQENSGVSSARNKGISYAKGKYICFLDSDDMVIAETIDKAIFLLEKEMAECITYDYKQIAESSSLHDFFNSYSEERSVSVSYDIKKLYNKYNIWTSIIKKEIIDENSIVFQEMKYFEDQCFLMDLCANNPKTIIISGIGYLYRQRNSSAMHCETRYKFWALDAIKSAIYTKKLEEKAINKEFKENCEMRKQLFILHAMTMGIMVPEFNANWILQELKDNNLFPFTPMWRLLVPNGKSTVLNYLRFGFFSKNYYKLFFGLLRMMKKIKST